MSEKEYAGGYIYEDGALAMIAQPEGYIEPDGSSFKYGYNYTDHLGNVRVTYADSDGNGNVDANEIIEEAHYYPFGLKLEDMNSAISANKNDVASSIFRFNGVEFELSLKLGLYEMLKRQYDPTLGRFTGVDPITHHEYTPYQEFDNNPVFWIDPTGADSYSYDWEAHKRGDTGIYINNQTKETTSDWQSAVSETTESSGIDSQPLTKRGLGGLLGTSNEAIIESRFEELFQEWGKENYLTFSVPEEHLNSDDFGDVLPDGISMGMTLGGRTKVAPNVAFWDAKATRRSLWGKWFASNKQFQAYVQILQKLNIKNTTKNVLIYVTTSDVINVNAARDYAEKRGVGFRHIVAYSEWGALGRYLVFKERKWTGVPQGGGKPFSDSNFKSRQEAVRID